MIHFVDLIIVSGEDKILISSRRWKNCWGFIRKEKRKREATAEIPYGYALRNLNISKLDIDFLEKHEWLGGENDEEVIADVEYWIIKLEYTPKLPRSLFNKYMWVDKEDAKVRTRNYDSDVFYYMQRYFGLC